MKKQDQIEAKRKRPIEKGDRIQISVPYTTSEEVMEGRGKNKTTKTVMTKHVFKTTGTVNDFHDEKDGVVYEIQMGSVRVPSQAYLTGRQSKYLDRSIRLDYFKAEHVSPTYDECGSNPFKKKRFRVSFYNQDFSSLLSKACYGYGLEGDYQTPVYRVIGNTDNKADKSFVGASHGGINFNPFVFDAKGEKQFYQRDLVWTLEQKQLLIDSIYNGIEIGKFLFRHNSWKKVEQGMAEDGHGFDWDCVDGKQRFFAILHFIQNKYPDSFGNYWDDLSSDAQNHIIHYNNLSYGEMGDEAKDTDVVETFLTLNFTGTPMSKEHIQFVQSFKM
jgi:hypothetical protein